MPKYNQTQIDKNLQDCWIHKMKMGWGKSSGEKLGFYFYQNAANFLKGGVVLDAGAGRLRFKPFFENSIYLSQEHISGIKLKRMDEISYDLISPLDQKIPLKDNCVDGIICNSTLEHLKYPEKFMAEAFRVLKPGGRLYISVPFICLEHEVPYDFQRPTRFGLKRWLEDVGFTKINIEAGSTCVQSLTAYLSVAIVYDLLQTNQNPKKLLFEILKQEDGIKKLVRKTPNFIMAGVAYIFMKLFVIFVNALTNVEVYQEANMPTGWLAVASKPGQYIKKNYQDKESFLRLYSLKEYE